MQLLILDPGSQRLTRLLPVFPGVTQTRPATNARSVQSQIYSLHLYCFYCIDGFCGATSDAF